MPDIWAGALGRRPSRDHGQPERHLEAVSETGEPPSPFKDAGNETQLGFTQSFMEVAQGADGQRMPIDFPRRQVSLESFGPSGLRVTEVSGTKSMSRFNRLPNDLEKKAKDLHHDLLALLAQAGHTQSSNVEFCVQSACNVLQHLCTASDLEYLAETAYANDGIEAKCSDGAGDNPKLWGLAVGSVTAQGTLTSATSGRQTNTNGTVNSTPGGGMSTEAQDESEEGRESATGDQSAAEPQPFSMLPLENAETWPNDATVDVGSRRRSFQLIREDSVNSNVNAGLEMHTSNNQCFIHPEKPFRLGWDTCSMILILVLSVVIPLEVCFFWDGDEPLTLQVFAEFIDIFFMIDIILNFVTAVHEGHGISGRLVTHYRGIAKRYAKGWLLVDVVASFPWLRVMQLFGATEEQANNTEAMGMLKVLRYAKVARMMKVLRVLKLGKLIQMVEEKMVAAQSMTVAFQLFKMTIVMLIISHNVACGWFAVAVFSEEPNTWLRAQGLDGAESWRQYVASFYFAITTGTTVGYGDIAPVNTVEQAVTVFVLVLSVGYIGQFLARVSQIVQSLRHLEAQTVQAKRDAMLFMKKRSVPKELQFKVLRYIEHVYETDAVTALDEKVMNILSESLKNQLALAVTGHVLRQFPLFETAEDSLLTALCQVVRTERAGVGDVVVTEEQAAHEMFWVVRGEAAVLRRSRQVGGLRTGDWFGELSLFFPGAVRKATVRCETNCEFVVLNSDQFQKTIEEFPKVRRQYEKIASDLRKGHPPGSWRAVNPADSR